MEPTVDSFVLHPSLLVASGFESISTRQVRFLHSYRRHFYTYDIDFTETIVISKKDFELGGIMNPFGTFYDIDSTYQQTSQRINNFPYLTRREIQDNIYADHIHNIWRNLQNELFQDLSSFCISSKRSRDFFQANTQVIHALSEYPIYQKICALHTCGLGGKLMDTFEYIFSKFKAIERSRNQPFTSS